ncbi:hypothetical protein RP20_CCG004239 [Aedes albopictus]|nr:hypothetical protein RP20_CCG004239 [Aedes albopictus]
MWWSVCAILGGIISAIYLFLSWNFNYWRKLNVTGPKPRLLFGNLPNVLMQKQHIFYEYQTIYNDFKSEPAVGYFSVRTPQLMVRDPELIKEVLIKGFRYFSVNNFSDIVDEKSDPLFGRNPFSLSGDKWKARRAEATPAFTHSRIKTLAPLMDEVCGRMSEYLMKHNGNALDTKELTTKYTTDVVSSCIFAIDAQSFSKDKPEIREMGRRMMDFSFSAQLVLMVTTFLPSIRNLYKFTFVPRDVEQFFIRIMKDAIRHRKENNIVRHDYLDYLLSLQAKKQISEIDMAGHGVSFFADGLETSSLIMTYCLCDLASNPEVQHRLREEIRHVQATRGDLDYDNIGEMIYLDQVLNESLRLHPIVPVLAKRCTESTILIGPKDKQIPVSAGTTVVVPLLVQLDSQYYPDPKKYNPERFSPENGGIKPYRERGVFFPFSEGPRMCLGMRFAIAQMKRGLVEILDKFELSLNSKTQVPLSDFKSEPVVGYFSVRTPQLMIRDPELIKEVMIKGFRYFAANEFSDVVDEKSDPLFARNPFSLSGEKWKTRRAEITPAFTNNRIKALSTLMDEVCDRMTAYVKKQNSSALDTKELMAKYTTDVVSNCVFAIDAQSFSKDKPEIREMGRRIMDFNFAAQLILMVTTFLPSIKNFYKFSFIPKEVEHFFIRIMQDAIRHRKDNNVVRNDYLDHLLSLQEKKQISEIDMAGHGVSFFADGFETSSLVMTYCLYDLASHPEIQSRLRDEIRNVQANKGGVNYDTIGEMTYLDQVLNESLRLHPIIPVLAKRCTEDTVLVGPKGKKIPVSAGTTVTIPYFVQLDPQYYQDPEKFDPERFSPENGGTKPYRERGVFLPFGEGPRMCLGMRFAIAQVKRGIVEILDKFELTVNAKTQVPLTFEPKMFMLYPVGGIWLDYKSIK